MLLVLFTGMLQSNVGMYILSYIRTQRCVTTREVKRDHCSSLSIEHDDYKVSTVTLRGTYLINIVNIDVSISFNALIAICDEESNRNYVVTEYLTLNTLVKPAFSAINGRVSIPLD